MTLAQLESLSAEELSMALYVVNVLRPPKPQIDIPPLGLTWFRKGELERLLIECFNNVKKEAHPIYSSLLTKLDVNHQIQYTPVSGSI
jgi:hypothetical protein